MSIFIKRTDIKYILFSYLYTKNYIKEYLDYHNLYCSKMLNNQKFKNKKYRVCEINKKDDQKYNVIDKQNKGLYYIYHF